MVGAPGPKTRTQLEFHWKPSVNFRLLYQWMKRQDKGLYVMFARVTGPDDHEELAAVLPWEAGRSVYGTQETL